MSESRRRQVVRRQGKNGRLPWDHRVRRRRALRGTGKATDDRQYLQLQRIHDSPDIGPGARFFMPSFLTPLLQGLSNRYSLRNERTQAILADHLVGAFDSASRRTGLLRHKALPDGHALIIAPTNAIHTWFMKFPIDVAFVAKDGRVLKTRSTLRPWRVAAAWRAHAVIELPSGVLERTGTVRGDRLAVFQ